VTQSPVYGERVSATSTAPAPPATTSAAPSRLPAGPRRPAALQSAEYGLDPFGFFGRAWRRFGDTYTVRVVGEEWVVLCHPDAVREVYGHGPDDLDSGAANLPLRPILGTRNVLLLDGSEHLRRRKLVLPPFHGERMKAYAGIVEEAADRELRGLPGGEPLAALPHMQAITFEVILRAVFGVDDAERLGRLPAALRRLLSWTTNWRRVFVFTFLGPERVMALPGFRRQLAEVDALVMAEIARRREAEDLAEREDVLSLLLGARDEDGEPLDDEELRDELVTLLVAGHETTAALLAWALEELARQPAVQDRLAAEDGFADAVVAETLRLRPPVPLGSLRRLRRPLRLAGRDLPAGATVASCAVVIHRRPDLYERPESFVPERFLETKPAAGAFLPFGGGVRRCVGAAFAQFEARLVLEAVARRFVLRPAGRPPRGVGRRGIVLVPRRGGRVVVTPRR
jgi:cytochrome P450 family 135